MGCILRMGARAHSAKRQHRAGAAMAALLGVAALAPLALSSAAHAQTRTIAFDIPTQPVGSALVTYARQAGVQLVMSETPSGGVRANSVRGTLSREQALEMLLEGTGYTGRLENGSIRLTRISGRPRADERGALEEGSADEIQMARAPSESAEEGEADIVVVGTNIRGAHPNSAPVEIFTAEDIARSGATSTEQFFERLPQNSASRSLYASSSGPSLNREAVSSIDLRGLGVGTTLTLLNGRRMALADSGQAADVSMIPVSAIERVEILTDGASAIYGSDAIGGVVNFVLRENFEGAETRAQYGGVTSGALRQGGMTQTFGESWRGGSGLVSFDYTSASALHASDRDFTGGTVQALGDLTPTTQRYSVLATGSQDLTERLTLDVDLSATRRNVKNLIYTDTLVLATPFRSETELYSVNLGLDYEINERLNLELIGSYSRSDVVTGALQFNIDSGVSGVSLLDFSTEYAVSDIGAKLDGVLFSWSGGDVQFSLGAGFLQEDYTAARTLDGASRSGRELGRNTTSAYGELLIPLVQERSGVPFVRELELSLAARYTSYEDASSPALARDFGDRTSPKLGLAWSPLEGLNLRATYGESFRAPALAQLDPTLYRIALQRPSAVIPIGGVPSTTITLSGPSPEIDPETATSYTFGFDYRVGNSFRLSATYFDVEYEDRIGTASVIPARAHPLDWPEIIWRPTSEAEILDLLQSGPVALNTTGIPLTDLNDTAAQLFDRLPNLWIIESRTRNLAMSTLDGVDVSFSQRWDGVLSGDLTLGAQVTLIFAYDQQASPSSPIVSVVDTVTRPADLRGRVFVTHATESMQNTLSLNYVDEYDNPLAVGAGSRTVDDWLTVDWALGFEVALSEHRTARLNLTVQNVFDEAPPPVATASTLPRSANFDPANANPLGRVVVLGASVQW